MNNQKEKLSPIKQALLAVEEMQLKLKKANAEKNEPIAVIGMSGRFPKSKNLDEFWELIYNRNDGITEVPKERWNIDEYYDPNPGTPGKMITKFGGFINDFDRFDAQFFGISPREALVMDPQQRALLEVTWEAFEDAGINIKNIAGSKTGVFIGISTNDYKLVQYKNANGDYTIIDAYQGSGNASSIAANRLSYFFDLQGPSISVDTACSSSLVSTHMACQSLRNGEADIAVSGGVGLLLSPHASITFSQANMLAPGGRCRTFDADAEGYVRGEGVGIIVLKRLSDAKRDNDNILAVIKSSAVNQDGKTNGLTAPNSLSQVAVITEALKKAKLKPDDIGYIESHGTGTILGDPIEVQALGIVMKERKTSDPCYLGAVKTNIGHLEAAAGIAGLIKTILALKNKIIPANLHFNKINPHIPINELPFEIPLEPIEWKTSGKIRYAGVSSFGFGGTNAHIILAEAEENEKTVNEIERPLNIFCLSAHEQSSLREIASKYINYLEKDTETPLTDICYTANTGRHQFNQRIAIPFETREELKNNLKDFTESNDNYSVIKSDDTFNKYNKTAFLFTGQGSQYPDMAKELYETQPYFRKVLDNCFEISDEFVSKPLKQIIFPEESASHLINETEFTQPALFAIEYSLAKMLLAWGLKPDYLIGHSIGEYAAACVAGVFSLKDGMKLTALRGKLMQSLPKNGSMAAIFADENTVLEIISRLNGKISIAGLNGPNNVVISGETSEIKRALELFKNNNIDSRQLQVSHAFHSELMEPILGEFLSAASEIEYKKPQIQIISNVTGKQFSKNEIPNSEYWKNHIRQAVRFDAGMNELKNLGCDVFLEIGPTPVLIGMGRKCISDINALWVGTLRKNNNDWKVILDSLGELYVAGINIDWNGFDEEYKRNKVQLPTYAFQKERFYVDPKPAMVNSSLSELKQDELKCLISEIDGKSRLKIVDKNNNLILDLSEIEVDNNVSENEFNNIVSFNQANEDIEQIEEAEIINDDFSPGKLKLLPFDEQKKLISEKLRFEVGKVLRLNKERIDLNKSITHLGLDSIMAIELKNNLDNKYKFEIQISELIQGPSLNDLSEIIIQHLSKDKKDEIKLQSTAGRIGDFELSYGQTAMWFQHQMAPAGIFNPTYAVKIRTAVDTDKFRNIIAEIISRHDELRATYHFINNKPVQRIHEQIETPFNLHNCEQLSEKDLDEKVHHLANEIFDLENGPIFKTHLFKIKNDEYLFLISAHHIAVDFWSQAIIVNEIAQLYQAETGYELPETNYSYIDFIKWQKEFVNSEQGAEQLKYWKNKLEGEIPNLDLPTVKTRRPVQTFNGASLTSDLDIDLTGKLKSISEEQNVTLYMTLLTTFKILLSKYTHQNDIILGTPSTGRSLSELKDIVGYFVNPLPIRTQFKNSTSFTELLAKVKNNILESTDNQDYPFNLIVEKIKPERDTSKTPIFQVMFVYQKAHVLADEGLSGIAVGKEKSTMQLGNLPIESYNLKESKSVFDMTMLAAETEDGITVTITYNTDLFRDRYIERFLLHFRRVVEQVVKNPNIKLSHISLVDSNYIEELSKGIDLLKEKQYSFVQKDFENIVKQYPDQNAVQYKNSVLTYKELNELSNQLANYLIAKNLKKETRIGVFVERSFDMIISILAVMKAGYVYVPIDTILPKGRINSIIKDANIEYAISHTKYCKTLQGLVNNIICLDTDNEQIEKYSVENPTVKLDILNLAYSIYTSGSTGKPKGVMLTHMGLSNLIENQTKIFNITNESKVLQLASLSFDASVSEIFTAIVNGATLHLVSQDVLLSGTSLINEINDKKISVATIPPSLLAVIPSDKLSPLKTLVSAGELCTKDIVSKWSNGRKFVNAYGPTEVTVCATTYNIPNNDFDDTVPIGNSINGMASYILDESLNPVPVCVTGELYVSGVGLARGYNNEPSLTAEKFIPNPFSKIAGDRLYKTGDLVKLKDTGEIEFLGRIDDQVKFRGFRIELSEIQTVLESYHDIIKAELLLKKNKNDQKLAAYYISHSNTDIEKNLLRNHILSYLPEYMMPSVFVHVDKMPLTHNGKVNKKALAKIKINDETRNKYEQPQSLIEKEIVEVWEEVLNIEDISTNDNFFDLGGHSLNVIQVQSIIKERFGKELTVVDFFKYPTIKLLAGYLSNGNNIDEKVKEVKERVDKRKNLLVQQQAKMRNRRNPK